MKYIRLIILMVFVFSAGKAQDPQFSQFYSAPLYMAPSFAGAAESGRVIMNFRDQWPGLQTSTFVTYAFSADYYFDEFKSGVGFLALRDQAGRGGLMNTTNLGLQYSYNFEINKDWRVRPGLAAYYYMKTLDPSVLVFGDQILRGDNSGSLDLGDVMSIPNVNHFDFTTSVLAYSNNYWVGITFDHLMYFSSILKASGDYLPFRYSAFAGAKFDIYGRTIKVREESVTVALNFMAQDKLKYLDLGMYYTMEPFIIGLWYRGLPVFPKNRNIGALAISAGYKYRAFKVSYSYDFTLTRLIVQTGGAHEVSMSYTFEQRKRRRTRHTMVPCPGL